MDLGDQAVVVTGGTGFLGRHVAAELTAAGARVSALGSTDYDLRQRSEIERMLAELKPDAVIHLAAVVGGIGANRAEPGRFFYENAVMGIELIEACRIGGVAKVVVSGTVCAYPKHVPVPFREENLWAGYPEETNAAYGLAKKMLLVQCQSYREQYGMNAIYVLPVNLYGPHDHFDLESSHVVPAMLRKFVEARDEGRPEVVLWGDGRATREFLYVDDAARAFRLALERYDDKDPVNIGSGQEISIRDLAETISSLTGFSGTVTWDTTKPNGQPRRRLDVSRAKALFGFEAEVAFADGLRRTYEWFEATKREIQPSSSAPSS